MFSALTSRCQAKTSSRCASRTLELETSGCVMIGTVPPHCKLVSEVQFRPRVSALGKSAKVKSGAAAGIFQPERKGLTANAPIPRPASLRNSRRERLCFWKVMATSIPVKWAKVNGHLLGGLMNPEEYSHLFQAFLAYFVAGIRFAIGNLRAGQFQLCHCHSGLFNRD